MGTPDRGRSGFSSDKGRLKSAPLISASTAENQTRALALSNSLTDLAARIKAEHDQVGILVCRSVFHAMVAGDLLIEAKAQLDHGEWLPWLRKACSLSERTAQLYMRFARNRTGMESNPQPIADLIFDQAIAVITKKEKEERVEAKIDRRAAREIELAESTAAASTALGKKLYGLIYADPPWKFVTYNADTSSTMADDHYPCMTTDAIKALEIPATAAHPCSFAIPMTFKTSSSKRGKSA